MLRVTIVKFTTHTHIKICIIYISNEKTSRATFTQNTKGKERKKREESYSVNQRDEGRESVNQRDEKRESVNQRGEERDIRGEDQG